MAGNVDLGHHGDAEARGIGDDLADRRLGVVAAHRLGARAEQRGHREAMAAPGADLGERRIGLDLDPPGLVIGEMPVEAVQLVPGEDAQEGLDLAGRIELARHVEMRPAPGERRRIADRARGREEKGRRMAEGTAEDLTERDQPIEEAGMAAAGDDDPGRGEIEPVGFGRQCVIDLERDGTGRPRQRGAPAHRPEKAHRQAPRMPEPPRSPRRPPP